MTDFRSVPGRSPVWHSTDASFSNFEFIDTYFGSHPILRRIFSLARKAGYKGVLTEQIHEDDCALLAAENAALAIRHSDFQSSQATRFSFFEGASQSDAGSFLGYAIFKRDQFADRSSAHVFEAVVVPARDHSHNNFTHCAQSYRVLNDMGTFSVAGVLYAQQNDATNVCAHVALRSMLACLRTEGDATYAEINHFAGVDHADPARRVGGGAGLSVPQVEAVLTGFGFSPRVDVHEPGQVELPPGLEFQRLLYDFIESGRPALLGFELAPDRTTGERSRHVIPIFGHTFNEDLWVPEAERAYFAHDRGFFPSESWLSTYVSHDDNFGPYVCLPRHYLGRDEFRLLIGCHEPTVQLPAVEAETLAIDMAAFVARDFPQSEVPWFERFRAFSRSGLLVLRAQIVNQKSYQEHLTVLRDREGFDLEPETINQLTENFPACAWMVEISAPELFPSTRAKFGEILIDATQSSSAVDTLHAARLPGHLFLRRGGQIDITRTRLAGHTPLFTYSST